MVSYGQTEIGQKIRGMQETYEDQFFVYQYDNRGNFIRKIKKTPLQSFIWWRQNLAYDSKRNRILPLSDFEKKMGIRLSIDEIWFKGHQYTSEGFKSLVEGLPPISDKAWNLGFRQKYDPADLQIRSYPDKPKHDWRTYLSEKAEKQNLIPVSIDNLEFEKKHPYCIANEIHGTNCNFESTPELQEIVKAENPQPIDKLPTPARPNPREVEKIEPIEVEPIKEAVKYSPLIIAGVIAVVVILLLKRRRA
mgnify:CR=1 FL=1|tara:strand:- start:290 stop:1036 length:747 start_codon:yes stop_codon:yes gene_type:complete